MDTRQLSPTQLGRRIRTLRLERQLSQEQLAGARYTAAYVSHVEKGKRRASLEALTYFAERLGLSYEQLVSGRDPNDDIRLEVDVQRAIARIHEGEPADARRLLETVREDATRLSAPRAVIRAEQGIALSLFREGLVDDALAAYERLSASMESNSPEERTPAIVGIGRCLFHKGKLREAVDLLEAHRARLERSLAPDPGALIQVYAALIGPYFDLGMIDKAKEVSLRGGEVAVEVVDPESLACLFINRAGLLLGEEQPREALMMLARAEEMYVQLGWRGEASKVAVARGMVLIDKGDVERAQSTFESVLEGGGVTARDEARALAGLAQVHRLMGDPQTGLQIVKKAVAMTKDLPTEGAEAKREAGLCAKAVGDVQAALRHWRGALTLYREAEDKAETAKVASLIGDALLELGETDKAAAAYREGLAAMGDLR